MDIRDSGNSNSRVISNIMLRKTSEIERVSRMEVAENEKQAKIKEIETRREAELSNKDAEKAIWEREAIKQQAVGIAQEQARQKIQEEAKVTREKDMAVIKIEEVNRAEIEKEKAIIEAEKNRRQMEILAEAELVKTKKDAEGNYETMKKNADGIKAEGIAQADARKLIEVAAIAWQIELAEKIAQSKEYMDYLQTIEAIKAWENVGKAKAEALKDADLKVIANTWDISSGVNNIMDLLSSKWGTAIGGMLESLKNTEVGNDIINKILPKKEDNIEIINTDESRKDSEMPF